MSERRCPSCEHRWTFHQADAPGCDYTVVDGKPRRNLGCPCARQRPTASTRAARARRTRTSR